jgi:hypothetical protein
MSRSRCNIFSIISLILFSISAATDPSKQVQGAKSEVMELYGEVEAQSRKIKSEKRLKSESVPINANLPTIESESEAKFRESREILQRALCLIVVALKGEGLEKAYLDSLIKEYDLIESFSPEELAFINSKRIVKKDKIKFTWKYEPATVLMWAIGFVPKLGRPIETCNVPLVVNILKSGGKKDLLSKSKMRSKKEILDEADLIYRYHWATRDAEINGRDSPAGLESGVVYERHYALNWLIGYMEQEWDDVSTDT